MGFVSVSDIRVIYRDTTVSDEAISALITDAEALAVMVAPCLKDEGFASSTLVSSVTAIIRQVVVRLCERGPAGVTTQLDKAGPFEHSLSFEAQGVRRGLLFPSEITALQKMCRQFTGKGNGSIGAAVLYDPTVCDRHAPACDRMFTTAETQDRVWCSCGSDINNGQPLRNF